MATMNGMAVLIVRVTFVLLSFYILRPLKWKEMFHRENAYYDRAIYWMVSIALGHLTGSFFITIIEIIQQILWSNFTY